MTHERPTKAEAEKLFAAAFSAARADEATESYEEYQERRFHESLSRVLTAVYIALAEDRGWPEGWPRWPDAMGVLDHDEAFSLLVGWVEHKLASAKLIDR